LPFITSIIEAYGGLINGEDIGAAVQAIITKVQNLINVPDANPGELSEGIVTSIIETFGGSDNIEDAFARTEAFIIGVQGLLNEPDAVSLISNSLIIQEVVQRIAAMIQNLPLNIPSEIQNNLQNIIINPAEFLEAVFPLITSTYEAFGGFGNSEDFAATVQAAITGVQNLFNDPDEVYKLPNSVIAKKLVQSIVAGIQNLPLNIPSEIQDNIQNINADPEEFLVAMWPYITPTVEAFGGFGNSEDFATNAQAAVTGVHNFVNDPDAAIQVINLLSAMRDFTVSTTKAPKKTIRKCIKI